MASQVCSLISAIAALSVLGAEIQCSTYLSLPVLSALPSAHF